MHQRTGSARVKEADGLSRICHALYAGESAGRANGFVRRRLRRVLPLSPACAGKLKRTWHLALSIWPEEADAYQMLIAKC